MEEKTYKVIEVLEMQTGTSERGEWKSQEVIVEECAEVQYPDRWLLRLSGSGVDQLAQIKVGDVVKAQWASSVREWRTKDGKVMHSQEHRCWKIVPIAGRIE